MARVTFIDVEGEQRLGAADLAPPAAGELLELLGEHWQVVKSEAAAVWLRKLQAIDPREILFSLPTVCDEVPAVDPSRTGASILQLDEDDWRQLEFVSPELRGVVEQQLERIRKVPRSGLGFTELHVRKEPRRPLLRPIELPNGTRSDGIAFQGTEGLVRDGFAIDLPGGATLYGCPGVVAITRPVKLYGDLLLVDWVNAAIL